MTVIGDAVNLTARIESATKMFGVPLLVSDDLFAEMDGSIRHRAVHRAVLTGKSGEYVLYELARPQAPERSSPKHEVSEGTINSGRRRPPF
jgi:adenylate cyclase